PTGRKSNSVSASANASCRNRPLKNLHCSRLPAGLECRRMTGNVPVPGRGTVMEKKPSLGRGLDALFGAEEAAASPTTGASQISHDQLAHRLRLGRTSITNLVALLELPTEIQDAVRVGQLSTGHAKLLKGVEDRDRQVSLCKEIVARGLSVHATEALLKQPAA